MKRITLDKLDLPNYDDIDYQLNQPEMTQRKRKNYIEKTMKNTMEERLRLNAYKANVTKEYNSRLISESERQVKNKSIDDTRVILNEYLKILRNKLKTITGKGVKGRKRKQRGGNVVFFNDPKQLLKKLELIVGEVLAGNTSIQMRNMGVNILDTLLKMSTINRPQYNKLYNQYFKL